MFLSLSQRIMISGCPYLSIRPGQMSVFLPVFIEKCYLHIHGQELKAHIFVLLRLLFVRYLE